MFYRIVRWIVAGGSCAAYRATITGRERLPLTGGYVLAPSHRSMMDIPLVAWVTPRRLRYMGKSSLFKIPVLSWFFRVLGGFPVERDGTDRKALRESIQMLQDGDILLVYPEGTRQSGPKIQPLQPGAAYLALRAGVPIVPVGIAGSEEILRTRASHIPRFAPVVMAIGEPIVTPARGKGVVPREQVDAITAQLHDTLQELLNEAYEIRDGANGS
jgi:1-acyl-sn-glycerol-3-phosphate acyltransferase